MLKVLSVPEFRNDLYNDVSLSRQKSLLSNLPDFTCLLESLNTPTMRNTFDFNNAMQNMDNDQSVVENYNFDNIDGSMYPESQNMLGSQLKPCQLVDTVPLPVKLESRGQFGNLSKDNSLDMEVERAQVKIEGNNIQLTSADDRDLDRKTMEEVAKKMNRCCMQLNIPKDPSLWSVTQVNQWANLIATECYNYEMVKHLHVDGTTLCMLKQEDFCERTGDAQLGNILHIELEIWRHALFIDTQSRVPVYYSNMQSTQLQQSAFYNNTESQIYTDLTNAIPQASYTITDIPTPVLSGPDMTMTLNEINQSIQCTDGGFNLTNYSPASTLGSCGQGVVGGWEDSLSDCGSSYSCPVTEEDNSRTSSPLSQSLPNCGNAKKGVKRYGAATGHTKHTIHLWQFLRDLLMQPTQYNNCIRWVDKQKGIFKIEDSTRVARLWGQRKNRPAMNYDKLSRSIRQYYKKGIIKKTEQSKRLVYQFCENYL